MVEDWHAIADQLLGRLTEADAENEGLKAENERLRQAIKGGTPIVVQLLLDRIEQLKAKLGAYKRAELVSKVLETEDVSTHRTDG
jgi:hypothetical protein